MKYISQCVGVCLGANMTGGGIVQGYCHPRFEGVRKLYEEYFEDLEEDERCSQVCAYVKGKMVVDLYGKKDPCANYGPNHLTVGHQTQYLEK